MIIPSPPDVIYASLQVRIIPNEEDCKTSLISEIETLSKNHLSQFPFLSHGPMKTLESKHPSIKSAALYLSGNKSKPAPYWQVDVKISVYICNEDDETRDQTDLSLDQVEQFTELIPLPTTRFEGLWESLHYGQDVKDHLLQYVAADWRLSEMGVDSGIVTVNGMLLLHGPPGTGKTSLCRALLQKVCQTFHIRDGILVEVKLDMLLSQWFSESSKRVVALFNWITTLAQKVACVGVMLDEVETLAMCRNTRNTSDPTDSIRVVNSLLIALDSLKYHSNVIVVCTSNLVDGIDPALMDRVDIRMKIEKPSYYARLSILHSIVNELFNKSVIQQPDVKDVEIIANICHGLSGRGLRKLGVLSLAKLRAMHVHMPITWAAFSNAMKKVAAEISGNHPHIEHKENEPCAVVCIENIQQVKNENDISEKTEKVEMVQENV